MSTDTDIVMSPVESIITTKDIFDPEMKFISVKEYIRDGAPNTARLEATINTVRLFGDFAENPSLIRRLSIPVYMSRRGRHAAYASAPETRAMSRNDNNCPRIKFVTSSDGTPLDVSRLQYHRIDPIPPNSANVVVAASLTVWPGNLYVISHVDARTRSTTTLVYCFVDFVEWPVNKPLRDSKGRQHNQYGIGNAELIAAFTQNHFGSMSRWVSDRYQKQPETFTRILAAAATLHAKRDARAYRRYFGRSSEALDSIPLLESDSSAPTVHHVQVSANKLIASVLDTVIEVRRYQRSDNVTPTLPEGVTLSKEYNTAIPVACSLTSEADAIEARIYINMGTYVRCFTSVFTDMPAGYQDALVLFGFARSFSELQKQLGENGGMTTYRATVVF